MHFVTIPTTGTSASQALTDQQILDNTKILIWNDGSVGIGTTCLPWYAKLSVNGMILCEEITVKLSDQQGCWPDYVFSDEYKLMTLKDLDYFITKNKHLPGVPTAVEVDEKGLKVGEMQNIQMEKIEELYLYIIELNKKIEKLEKQVEELENQ